jgi:hypothetical protein
MSARLWLVCLFAVFTVAAMSALPKIDLPETAFDETDTPTVQAVVMTKAASWKCILSGAASAPIPFARTCNAQARVISPEYTSFKYTNRLSDLCQVRERLSIIRC